LQKLWVSFSNHHRGARLIFFGSQKKKFSKIPFFFKFINYTNFFNVLSQDLGKPEVFFWLGLTQVKISMAGLHSSQNRSGLVWLDSSQANECRGLVLAVSQTFGQFLKHPDKIFKS
jgi:hypothetical protein